MDSFFNVLKKGLVAMLFVVVGFAMTYVPQLPSSQVPQAEAGGLGGISTSIGQGIQNATAVAGNAINTVTAGAVSSNWIKENVLDGLGWAIAKRIVSGMVRSLINWVNSGFQGSPAFVTDLKGFLLNIADEEIGNFIQNELGDIGSFICSPFRLDVQVSVAMQYAQGRATGQSAPTCTLTGVIDNIEGFISGIDPGNGLSDWLQITSTPQTYTPYGATLNAEVTARARLINAQGQELTQVNWGDGFLSQKICESVGGDSAGQQCSITKPGRVIADQLNKALGAGQDSLIQADEINELISALLGQLANQALTGVAGLLGLSGGTGYSYSGYDGSYLDQLVAESDGQILDGGTGGTALDTLTDAIELEIEYRDMLTTYRGSFVVASNNVTIPASDRQQALAAVVDIDRKLAESNNSLQTLIDLTLEYPDASAERQVEILITYTGLRTTTEAELLRDRNDYSALVTQLEIDQPTPARTTSLADLLTDIESTSTVDPTDQQWIDLAADLGITITSQP